MRTGYSTDLTDAEWAIVEPHLPPLTGTGAPRTVKFRSVIHSILYLNKTGCPGGWYRELPNRL